MIMLLRWSVQHMGNKNKILWHKRSPYITASNRKRMIFSSDLVYLEYPEYVSREMLLSNTVVESSVCNCVCVCACCSVGPLQSYCCCSYHPGQEKIACQNKRSHFRAMGRQCSERMQLGCLFFIIHSGMPTNKVFVLLEGESQTKGKPFIRIMSRLVFHAVVVLFILHQWHRKKQLQVDVMPEN